MKYIFSGDIQNVCLTLHSDPDETDKSIAMCWTKAEFAVMTGITVPDNVEGFSLEPGRDIYSFKEEDQMHAEFFDDPVDAPQWMKDLWAKRVQIRKHLKAAIMEMRDTESYLYHYDEQLDQIIQEEHPEREHLLALSQLSRYKMTARVVVDLIDLLVQKGVITEQELPAYFNLTQAKDLMSKINWSNM